MKNKEKITPPCGNRGFWCKIKDCFVFLKTVIIRKFVSIWSTTTTSRIVSGQFGKTEEEKLNLKFLRENDWYYQHSWFSSYFWNKLKRNLMNIIYKLYTSISELLLEKYFVEITFYSSKTNKIEEYNKKHKTMYHGDFKCYLPLIIEAKNYDEAEFIIGSVVTELTGTYGCSVVSVPKLLKISKISIQDKIDIALNKLNGTCFGVLNLETLTPKPLQPQLLNEIEYVTRRDKYTFNVLKTRDNILWANDEYFVQVVKLISEE